MEKVDLFDKNRMPIGKSIEKFYRRDNPQGEYYKYYVQVVHITIFNSKGEMLIQQRQSTKRIYPNLWDLSVGGSVISGETPCEGAERELLEEIGVKYSFNNIRPVLTTNFDGGFDDYFQINLDLNLNDLKLQDEEVQNVKWATLDEILNLIKTNEFINYNENFIKLLFDLNDKNKHIINDK